MISKLTEVILYVKDMENQVLFYRDILKLPLEYPSGLGSYANEQWVLFDTGPCKLALHGGGHKDFGRDAPKFVFGVENLKATRELLSLKGVSLSAIRCPAPGVEVVDAEDPEGNVFSIECRSETA